MDARDLRQQLPSYGPDWDAAIEAGIDVSLIEHNLSLTPDERIAQLMAMTRTRTLLQQTDDSADSTNG